MRARYGEPRQWLTDVISSDVDGCINWPYGTTAKGYGAVWSGGKMHHAHRLVCELAHGSAKHGETDAAHSCGNRLCCNPKHIRHSTPLQNQRDKIAHGTSLAGTRNPNAKLTVEQKAIVRAAPKASLSLAQEFGVALSTLYRVRGAGACPS